MRADELSSAALPSEPSPPRRHLHRGWMVVGGVALAAVVCAGAMGLWFYHSPQMRHERVLARVDRWTEWGNKPTALEEVGIYEVKRAIHTALGNAPFWHWQNAPTEKLVVVADYLDRTHGEDFKSFAGSLHVVALLEEVSPTFHEFGWIETLREMQAGGEIPASPVIPGAPAKPAAK